MTISAAAATLRSGVAYGPFSQEAKIPLVKAQNAISSHSVDELVAKLLRACASIQGFIQDRYVEGGSRDPRVLAHRRICDWGIHGFNDEWWAARRAAHRFSSQVQRGAFCGRCHSLFGNMLDPHLRDRCSKECTRQVLTTPKRRGA